jgi:hypothetical protein
MFCIGFEYSIGVVETKCFRTTLILQGCQDNILNRWLNLFTKAIDVYSYKTTYNKILTNKFPFECHSIIDYDIIRVFEHVELWYTNYWTCMKIQF